MAAAAGGGGSVAISSFLSSSSFTQKSKSGPRVSFSMVSSCSKFRCFAIQDTPAAAAVAAETKDEKKEDKEAAATTAATAPPPPAAAKPKPAMKAAVKPLAEMMTEEVIPSLRSILGSQEDITQLELNFEDNTLEGSFLKKDIPYTFWAFFPDGVVTGSRGFSLSSYGQGVSTVEPFLIDERKITDKHVVFWVEKRLAAQGIIPVWND